jgi:hypothetical protein
VAGREDVEDIPDLLQLVALYPRHFIIQMRGLAVSTNIGIRGLANKWQSKNCSSMSQYIKPVGYNGTAGYRRLILPRFISVALVRHPQTRGAIRTYTIARGLTHLYIYIYI